MKKRIVGLVLALIVMLSVSIPALADAPSIKKTEYDKNGRVEVEFKTDVKYSGARVTVKDDSGKSYTAKITDRDDDELEFKISNIAAGKKYNYTISGVRKLNTSGYGSASGSFTVAGSSSATGTPVVDDLDYESKGYVEVEFKKKVQYKNAKVTVTDSDGKSYTASIIRRGNEEFKFRVRNIDEGKKYNYTISGVALKGSTNYSTVSGTFWAYDD